MRPVIISSDDGCFFFYFFFFLLIFVFFFFCFVPAGRLYFDLEARVEQGEADWEELDESDESDLDQIVILWRQAAEEGHAGAQCNLGLMFKLGRGLAQSDRCAVLHLAAPQVLVVAALCCSNTSLTSCT